jgi:fumarylacetoacetase
MMFFSRAMGAGCCTITLPIIFSPLTDCLRHRNILTAAHSVRIFRIPQDTPGATSGAKKMNDLNETHDPNRRSFVESANRPGGDFPIQNLPFCMFRRLHERSRAGIAIGDCIFDLGAAVEGGLLPGMAGEAAQAASGPNFNPLMAIGTRYASALRSRVSYLLRAGVAEEQRVRAVLVSMDGVTFDVPAAVGTFTDFLCSYDHTLRMSRTGELPPAFKYLPIAYHSRASTIVAGGTVRRPNVQYKDKDGSVRFGPEPSLDFELEMGAYVGEGNAMGDPITLAQASDRIFGYCLLNDWSARGIQGWESTPLGPFLGKSFATSISPFIVTSEALLPFHVPSRERLADDPKPFSYLTTDENTASGALDITLDAYLLTPQMRRAGVAASRITRTNFRHMYWNFPQMLTHHASNGCSLQPGDLLGSGTASGPSDDSRACLAEISKRGTTQIAVADGEGRAYLLDGDEVIFRGRAEREGYVSIGFGECRGTVLPAVDWPAE